MRLDTIRFYFHVSSFGCLSRVPCFAVTEAEYSTTSLLVDSDVIATIVISDRGHGSPCLICLGLPAVLDPRAAFRIDSACCIELMETYRELNGVRNAGRFEVVDFSAIGILWVIVPDD